MMRPPPPPPLHPPPPPPPLHPPPPPALPRAPAPALSTAAAAAAGNASAASLVQKAVVVAAAAAPLSVFVGKIPSSLGDEALTGLLEACGAVSKWARQSDPLTKVPKAFGFAEYNAPLSALRALRLLPLVDVGGGQRLAVNVQKAVRAILDE